MGQRIILSIILHQIIIFKAFGQILTNFTNRNSNAIFDCAIQIYSSHSERYNLIAYLNEIEGVNYFLENINKIAAKPNILLANLNKKENTTNNFTKYGMYTILIKNTSDFLIFIERFSSTSFWNPRSKFLLLYLEPLNAKEIFKISWANYILNIIVLTVTLNDVNIFTYFPYKNDNCGHIITEELLGSCATANIENAYLSKVPIISNSCQCKVMVNIFVPSSINIDITSESSLKSGFEVLLIGNALKRTNLSIFVSKFPGRSFNVKYPNGTYGGPIQYLFTKEYDLIFGHFWPLKDYYLDFDVVYPYLFDKVAWYVPAALPGAQWKSIILVFQMSLWLIVLSAFIANIFIWWVFGKNAKFEYQLFHNISLCALYCWYSFLLGPHKLPKTSPMRCLVIFWVLYSFVMSTMYQSQLLSILTTPVYEHQISNLQELVDSSIRIKFEEYFLNVYNNSDSQIERQVAKKAILQTVTDYLDTGSQTRKENAFIEYPYRLQYNAANYTNPDGSSMVYELPETVFTSQVTMYAVKGYPYLDRINNLIMRIWQNGLLAKWINDVNRFTKFNNVKNVQLTINHFIGAYYVLVFGIFIALITFCCEIFAHKRTKILFREK